MSKYRLWVYVGRNSHWVFLLLICLQSLIIRINIVTHLSYGFEQDELECTSVPALQNAGLDPSLFTLWSRQVNAYPVSPWLMSMFYSLLGPNIYSARSGLAILLSLTLIPFYLLVRRVGSGFSAICGLSLFAFSSYYMSLGLVAEQPPFAPFPYIITLLFFVLLFSKPDKPVCEKRFLIYALLLSSFSVITMFTYNQNFLFPFVIIGAFTIFIFINKDVRKKTKALIFLMLCVPYIFYGPRIAKNFMGETYKSYALEHSLVIKNGDYYRLSFTPLFTNIFDFIRALSHNIGRDMIVSHNNAVVPLLVLFLCIIGLIYSLTFINRFYFLLPLFVQVIIQHIVFGLNLPRMWINTVILIYILVALGVYTLEQLLNKLPKIYLAVFGLSIITAMTLTIYREANIVLNESVKNNTFRPEWEELYAVLRSNDLRGVKFFIDDHNFLLVSSLYPLVWLEQKLPVDSSLISSNIKIVTVEDSRAISSNYPLLRWQDTRNGIRLSASGNPPNNRALIFDTRVLESIISH